MTDPQDIRARKPTRLRSYDYATPDWYFVTICAHDRRPIFGHIHDGAVCLNEFGDIALTCWHDLPRHYAALELDACIIMPNHMHGIVVLLDPLLTDTPDDHPPPLTEVVRAFTSFTARRINELRDTPGVPVWQRSFHDHIIQPDVALARIRDYIAYNPASWADDTYHVP